MFTFIEIFINSIQIVRNFNKKIEKNMFGRILKIYEKLLKMLEVKNKKR